MSVQAMTRVMECSKTKGMTRFVLMLIANHESEDRGAWPSIERLAHEAGAGIRTVQDAIRRAVTAHELRVDYRAGPHGTNVYRVLVGLSTTATLPGTEDTHPRTQQNPHPADHDPESAPEPKELGVRGRSTAQASSGAPARPEVQALCALLADLIEANGVKRPSITARWYDECRRLIDRDGYTPEQIEAVIRWAQADGFWRSNILSMPKLREKFSALSLRMREPRRQGAEHVLDRKARELFEGVSANGQRRGESPVPALAGELPRVAGQ